MVDSENQQPNAHPHEPASTPKVRPSPDYKNRVHHCRPDQTPLLKQITEVVACVAGVCVLAVYVGQLREMRNATKASEVAASAARDAVNNSVVQFRTDERAWLELEPLTDAKAILSERAKQEAPDARPLARNVIIKNYGRTIAKDISIRVTFSSEPETYGNDSENLKIAEEALRLGKNTNTDPSKAIYIFRPSIPKSLAPQTPLIAPFPIGGIEYQTNKESRQPFVVGRIDYVDAFGVCHWKTFCLHITKEGQSYCQAGNDEDTNPEVAPTK